MEVEELLHPLVEDGAFEAMATIGHFLEQRWGTGFLQGGVDLLTLKRLTMKGLIVGEWLEHRSEFENEVGRAFQAGKLKSLETVVDGIEQAVSAFTGLFDGKNVGKMVVKL